MPNAIFFWKHYTRSFPAEKTGWWKMVSENEINHAKAVQGVCMKWTSGFGLLNCLLFSLSPPFFFFSQLFERVLRAKRQVNGLGYTFFSFSFFQTSLHLRKESRAHVCLISRHKHKREKKISQFLLVLRRDTEGKINSGFQIFSLSQKKKPYGSNKIFL